MNELERLQRLLDARLSALFAPLARALGLALGRTAQPDGTIDARRVDPVRAMADEGIEALFGTSARDQFDVLGVPQTPMAQLISEGVWGASGMALTPTIKNVDEFTRQYDDVRKALLRGGKPDTGQRIVDTARTWVDPNGYQLSHRIWNSGQYSRTMIETVMDFHIQAGTSAVKAGRDLEAYLSVGGLAEQTTKTPYGTTGLYAPRRLMRTETARAFGQSTEHAAQASPWIKAVGWRLSASHPKMDQCDTNATQDLHGLGAGNYPPTAVPTFPNHPQDLCFLVQVPVANPERVAAQLGQWARGENVPGYDDLADIASDPTAVIKRLTGVTLPQPPKPPLPPPPEPPKPKQPRKPRTPKAKAPPPPAKSWPRTPPSQYTIPPPPASFRTPYQAEQWCKQAWPHMVFDFDGMHRDTLGPTITQFHRLAEDFPRVVQGMKYMGTYSLPPSQIPVQIHDISGAYAHANHEKICFNRQSYSNPTTMLQGLQSQVRSGFIHKNGDTFEALVTHEFGHVVDYSYRYGNAKSLALHQFVKADGTGMAGEFMEYWQARNRADESLSGYAKSKKVENFSEGLGAIYHQDRDTWPKYVQKLELLLDELRATPHLGRGEWEFTRYPKVITANEATQSANDWFAAALKRLGMRAPK